MTDSVLRIIPLGGLGEVGRNCMVYEYDGEILVVDSGLMFPENDMLGIDYIIPDFSYLTQNRERVRGIIITHGHEDHTGGLPHLLEELQAPIYATPLTRGLIEIKLAKRGVAGRADLHTVQAGYRLTVGPFQVDLFHVCHSIPDGIGLGIQTPVGLIVHSGDYKFDHTPVDGWPSDYAALADFSRRGVLALLSDSTNAERPGWTPSERVVDAAFDQVFREAPNRIIIASFASLISRVQQVSQACTRYNRKLALAGASMVDNVKMARKLGYLDIPEEQIVSIESAVNLPDSQVVIMCTGSQGEPTSVMGRLSMGTNRLFDVQEGDTIVLSSHPIPGNEENVYRTINRLFALGANVVYESLAPVHVSGHASQEEMKLLLHLTQPKYVIPVHGELRHLRQAALLAGQVGIPSSRVAVIENGQIIEFTAEGEMRLGGRVPAATIFVDGSGVGDISEDVMRERDELARDGIVMVHILLDKFTGRLSQEPEFIIRGFMMSRDAEQLIAGATHRIEDALLRPNGQQPRELEKDLRSFLFNETGRRPSVFVTVNRV